MRRSLVAVATLFALLVSAPVIAQKADDGGVVVRRPSFVRFIVPAYRVERAGELQYTQLKTTASSKKQLLPPDSDQAKRVQRITNDLLPFAEKWNPRAKEWKWETIVIKTPAINAFCMPGGKIAVFTGIMDSLKLSDAELAAVVGHEIAHALREHARARAAKSTLTQMGAFAVSLLIGGNMGEVARQGGGLLALKFSRDDERDADLIGLELAARAGYNPEAGVTLWQKMGQINKAAPPPWLSTHPSGEDRIARIQRNLPRVMPLYEKARAARGATAAPVPAGPSPN